jgi:ergothioneine biosynthesis protein EgtB
MDKVGASAHLPSISGARLMAIPTTVVPTARELSEWVRDAREKTLALVGDLSDEQLIGPRLPTLNPLLWEIGHVAWFQERWVLRHANGRAPIRDDADCLYDSTNVPHDTRWDLPLPARDQTLAYMRAVLDRIQARLEDREPDGVERYFILLSVFHEDMHTEAFTATRQILGYAPPRFSADPPPTGGAIPGDVDIPGGGFSLGATTDQPFVFDNEKWAHANLVAPFSIARAAVTQAEFAAFVDAGGYRRESWWSRPGWEWRNKVGAEHPVYWRRSGAKGWERRTFDHWVPLESHRPVINVSWFEADAYCCWAGRRLPTEAEWEVAAAAEPDASGRGLSLRKRLFPWGDEPPSPTRAHLTWRGGGCADVGGLAGGDSAFGCRQMTGNVWEWTASDFLPYPGFIVDPYKEYSQPWFGTHKVLRGGCWATRERLLRNTWRNFYEPHRRDVWAGFRTCAVTRPV